MSSDDEAPRTPVRKSKRRSTNTAQRSMPRRSLRTPATLVTETPVTTSTPKHKKLLTVSEPRYNLRKHTSMSSYLATFSSDEESNKKQRLVRKQLHTAPKSVTVPEAPPLSSTTLREPKLSPAKQQRPARVQPTPAPRWMQLGRAEFFLALLLVVMVGIMLWYYYNYYTPTK